MFTMKTTEELQTEMQANVPKDGTFLTSEGSYFSFSSFPVAQALSEAYYALSACVPMIFVDETSGTEIIEKTALQYGLERKDGVVADVDLLCTGTAGCTIAQGTRFSTAGGLTFMTAETAIIFSSGATYVACVATDIGVGYNVDADTITVIVDAVSGLAAVTNPLPALGGTDVETDSELLARLYQFWRDPATSGNCYEYQQWALAVDGIGYARCVECWNGAGTVLVVIADQERLPVDEELRQTVATYIETQRPIGAQVTVKSVQAADITLAGTVVLDLGATLEAVLTAYALAVQDYFDSVDLGAPVLSHHQLVYLLMDVDGVTDYVGDITINGSAQDVVLNEWNVPRLDDLALEVADDGNS